MTANEKEIHRTIIRDKEEFEEGVEHLKKLLMKIKHIDYMFQLTQEMLLKELRFSKTN